MELNSKIDKRMSSEKKERKEYCGAVLSVISKSEIRYVGTLSEINTMERTLLLKNVQSHGSEGRRGGGVLEVGYSEKMYYFIKFKLMDLKDFFVLSPPTHFRDPAIISKEEAPNEEEDPKSGRKTPTFSNNQNYRSPIQETNDEKNEKENSILREELVRKKESKMKKQLKENYNEERGRGQNNQGIVWEVRSRGVLRGGRRAKEVLKEIGIYQNNREKEESKEKTEKMDLENEKEVLNRKKEQNTMEKQVFWKGFGERKRNRGRGRGTIMYIRKEEEEEEELE